MIIHKCDKCGKEINGEPSASLLYHFAYFGWDKDDSDDNFDLCYKCAEKLKAWLKNDKAEIDDEATKERSET